MSGVRSVSHRSAVGQRGRGLRPVRGCAVLGTVALLTLAQSPPAQGASGVARAASTTAHAVIVSPPPRAYDGMAYDAVHGEVVMFGGYYFGALDDTWTYDGSSWTERFPA